MGNLGQKFRLLRMVKEISMDELSEKTGVKKGAISGFENGNKDLGAEKFMILCKGLKINQRAIALEDPFAHFRNSLDLFFEQEEEGQGL